MKQILTSLLLLIAVAAHGQTFTNITIRVTRDTIVTGVSTNSANTSLDLVYGTPKDKVMIDGLIRSFNNAQAGGFTNVFSNYIAKNLIKDFLKANADVYNRIATALMLKKLTDLFTIYPDLVSDSQRAAAIAISTNAP